MPTEAVENYLKAIYTLCAESPAGEAGMTRVAAAVGVTTGTATSMAKKLAAAKLVRYERFGGVSLTPKGSRAALDILRRHRLVETFLVETLKLDWSQVHDEAERLEHAISPRVLDALDRHLGHPRFDPHGDPIPAATGELAERALWRLSEAAAGARVRVAQVLDQRGEALQFLERSGLTIGAEIRVLSREPGAGIVNLEAPDGSRVAMSDHAARSVLVQAAPPAGVHSADDRAPRRRRASS